MRSKSRSKVTQGQGHSRVAPRLKALSEWSWKMRSRSRSKSSRTTYNFATLTFAIGTPSSHQVTCAFPHYSHYYLINIWDHLLL